MANSRQLDAAALSSASPVSDSGDRLRVGAQAEADAAGVASRPTQKDKHCICDTSTAFNEARFSVV